LNYHKVEYIVAGAYAMSKAGYSRSTYDIDGLIANVLSINDLIINKSQTDRAKDKLDVEQLKQLQNIQEKSSSIIKK
jgi:hypothetical protein